MLRFYQFNMKQENLYDYQMASAIAESSVSLIQQCNLKLNGGVNRGVPVKGIHEILKDIKAKLKQAPHAPQLLKDKKALEDEVKRLEKIIEENKPKAEQAINIKNYLERSFLNESTWNKIK